MSDFASLNPRQLHVAREQALDRMRHAWYAAAVSGALGAIIFSGLAIDTGDWGMMAPYLVGAIDYAEIRKQYGGAPGQTG